MKRRLQTAVPRQLLSLSLFLLLLQWTGQVQAVVIHACEGNHVQITCPMPTTQAIIIRSAMYGRRTDAPQSPGRCGDNIILRRHCEHDVTQYMKFQCEGHPTCEVYVDVATFNVEFCVDVMKYVEVDYDCVPSQTLASVQQCYQTCVPPAAEPAPHPFGSKQHGQQTAKTQIPGPTGQHGSKAATPTGHRPAAAHAPSPARPSGPAPSPAQPRPHRKPSPPPAGPSIPALPYGNLNRSIAQALIRAGRTGSSTPAAGRAQTRSPQSAALRASLMSRMQRMLQILRNRKMRRGG